MVSSSAPPSCPACGQDDWSVAFDHLRDRLHDIPGEFTIWRCDSCSLLRLWPLPEDMSLYYPTDYYSYASTDTKSRGLLRIVIRYVRRTQLLLAWRAHRLGIKLPRLVTRDPWRRSEAFRELSEYAPAHISSVLDIGCGGGDFLASARELGLEVCGLEMSDSAACAAKRRGIRCEGAGIEGLAQTTERYDVIRLSDALEHLDDPQKALKLIARSLSPKGVVIVRVPNTEGVFARLCGTDWFPLEAPRHLWGFAPGNLTMLMEQAGLTVRRLETRSNKYILYYSLRNLVQSQAGLEIPRDATRDLAGLCASIVRVVDPADLGDHLVVVAERGAGS